MAERADHRASRRAGSSAREPPDREESLTKTPIHFLIQHLSHTRGARSSQCVFYPALALSESP